MKINFQKQETRGFRIDLTDGGGINGYEGANRIEFRNMGINATVNLNTGTSVDIDVDESWLTLRCMENDRLAYSYLVPAAEIKRVEVGNVTAERMAAAAH